jgi:N-acetylmuramoyl-L-alanine amidase CwlA
MAFTIIKNLIPGLPQEAYDGGVGAYIGVVAHATANNGDSADAERTYESTTWQSAFVHFFVDDQKIEQVADTNYVCYGAGHTANHSGYAQVELCQSTDATKFANAYAQYVWLLAYLLYARKLGVTDGVTLMSHAEVSAKWKETDHTDPIEYLASHGKTWANVITDVTAQYKLMEVNAMTTSTNLTAFDHVTINTQAGLNLRTSYNTTSTVLAVIPYGTVCTVQGTEPGWYEVLYGSLEGWVSAQYVTFTPKVVPVIAPVAPVDPAPKVVVAPVVPAVVPVAPVVAPAITSPIVPVVSTVPSTPEKVSTVVEPIVTPPVGISVVASPVAPVVIQADFINDPTNLSVLKEMYDFLNKIFGGK